MGFRTVLMLNNDCAHDWEKDPDLGRKIAIASFPSRQNEGGEIDNYGRVVECCHADGITVAVLDGYTSFRGLGYNHCGYGPTTDKHILDAVKNAADKLGYRLVKKAVK